MKGLVWLRRSLRTRSPLRTLQVAVSYAEDHLFDWRYGTDTVRRMEVRDMAFESESKAHTSCYGATKARPLKELLHRLRLPREATLVDIGSGKGRVLMVGALCGFNRLVGLEFAPELCEIANRNLELFRAKTGTRSQMQVVQGDAVRYEFTASDRVFFMFNPFGPEVLEKVVANLARSLERDPRPCWWIYLVPRFGDVITRSGVFSPPADHIIRGAHYRVWHHPGNRRR